MLSAFAVDALWRGTDEASKTLRKHSRQFNNALALASELYEVCGFSM